MGFKNSQAGQTAKGSLTDNGDSATILTAAQTANGVIIRGGLLTGVSGYVLNLSIGGSVTLRTSPVTHEANLPEIRVQNEAVSVAGVGTGTGYYTITYEWE